MPKQFKTKLTNFSFSSIIYHRKFSATPLSTQFHQLPTQEHSLLLNICTQECKKFHSRQLFDRMPQRLKSSLNTGKSVHARSLRHGFSLDGRIGNAILDLYAKCGNTNYVEKLFSLLHVKDEFAWNSVLVMKSRKGLFMNVLKDFSCMWSCGELGNQFTFAVVLSASAKLTNLHVGKQVHCVVTKTGLGNDSYCEGALIDMYAKCGELVVAKRIFDQVVDPDTISCTALMSGFALAGMNKEAMEVFDEMRRVGIVPDQVVFGTVLNAFVGQGRLEDAWCLFSRMTNPNVVAWNIMISGHVKCGNEEMAIAIFKSMIGNGNQPTRSTLGSVLRAIASVANHGYGLQVHAQAMKRGLDSNVYTGSSLINMYAKCQKMEAAKMVFDELEEKNDVLWNSLIGGYAQNGYACEVLELFVDMKMIGLKPDEYTYTSMLSACACLENIDTGRKLHSFIIKSEFSSNLYVLNALVDMYAKCGALRNARFVFEQIRDPDHVSWNAIVVGYVQEQKEEQAFSMFRKMISTGVKPDEVSLASLLSATANLQDFCKGEQLHCVVLKHGLEKSLYVGSSLIDMYCKCGIVKAAAEIFSCIPERSLVCVNALISGFARFSLLEAVGLLKCMLVEGLKPSVITFATLLQECTDFTTLKFGEQMHSFILKLGFSYDDEFLAVSLLGMYMNAQRISDAINLFSEIPHPKSTTIWTVLISGNVQNDNGKEAIHWYGEMRFHNVMPDQATFASVLKACSTLASLQEGRKIHSLIFLTGFDRDELTGSVLVDMYAKCGDVKSSSLAFTEMISRKDVISWNSMIVGYAKNGFAEDALIIFDEMKWASVEPDEVTYLGVLTACSHAGMVSKGREIYENMISSYGVKPRMDHCACMVDLFGRWGFLNEAENFIQKMDLQPDSMIWATYLNVCRLHNDDIRGQYAAEKLIELEPEKSSSYVLLSNIHAASGNWDGVNLVRKEMNERGVKKVPGCSWIVVGDKTSLFVAGDKNHPNGGEIVGLLKDLVEVMKDKDYSPESKYFGLGKEQTALHFLSNGVEEASWDRGVSLFP